MKQACITVRGQRYTIGDARQLARELDEACAAVQPASKAGLGAIAAVAQAQHGVELWEVAGVAGVNLDNLTVAGAAELFATLGRWEDRLAAHLVRVLEPAQA